MGWFSSVNSKVATVEKPLATEKKDLPKTTAHNSSPVNAELAQSLNASLGSALEPVQIKDGGEYTVLNQESVEKLDSGEKDIFSRFVNGKDESVAVRSTDGNTIITLCDGPTSSSIGGFNNGTINWMFGWLKCAFGGVDNRYAIKWLNKRSENNDNKQVPLASEPVNHIVKSLKAKDYRTISIFQKDADGKFKKLPEAVAIIDTLGKIPDEVLKHAKLGPIAKGAKEAIAGIDGTYLIDQFIVNPDSPIASDPSKLSKVVHEFSEGFFIGNKELVTKTKSVAVKPATHLLFPMRLRQPDHATSKDLVYDTIKHDHIVQDDKGDWTSSSKVNPNSPNVMTFVRPKDASKRAINPEFAYLTAWAQLTLGREFPSNDTVLQEFALKFPETNAKAIEEFNAKVAPKPIPITTEHNSAKPAPAMVA